MASYDYLPGCHVLSVSGLGEVRCSLAALLGVPLAKVLA
jgi:hypothetical protein